MASEIMESRKGEPVLQFSIYADNKVGRLNDFVGLLDSHDVHIVALCTQDTTDSTIIRIIVDYPEEARKLLREKGYFFTENALVAVEIDNLSQLKFVTSALILAEINIHYIYSFFMRPHGKSALAMRLEDNDLAEDVLKQKKLSVLRQSDIAR